MGVLSFLQIFLTDIFHRYLLTRIDVLLWIFAKPNTSKPNICSPGLVSCSSQCFQPSLQLSTFSTQSGQASCLPPSSGWRSPPENMKIEIHHIKGHVITRAHITRSGSGNFLNFHLIIIANLFHLIIIANLREERLGWGLSLSGRRLFADHDSGPQGEYKKSSENN